MKPLSAERVIGLALAGGALALGLVLALVVGAAVLDPGHSPAPSGSGPAATVAVASTSPTPASTDTPAPTGQVSPSGTPADSATPRPGASPTLLPTPAPTPTPADSPPLPAMLAAIGDSYTQAWSVSPAYLHDHPGYSWAIGGAKGDGVFSLRERFEALGDKLTVVGAATSGRKMSDASRQATRVVSYARSLPRGATAYVTFELGTNDLCDNPPTDPADFETQLRSAISILRSGLPSGSRILMLSIPDFSHFYDITQANASAAAKLALPASANICPPFLGTDSPLTIEAARAILTDYDGILVRVCDEIEAGDGPSGRLHCTHNEALLSESDFRIADLSTVDYFHPSLSGQARMADAAWSAGPWSRLKLPSGARAVAPAGSGTTGLVSLIPAGWPLLGLRLRRRVVRAARPARPARRATPRQPA